MEDDSIAAAPAIPAAAASSAAPAENRPLTSHAEGSLRELLAVALPLMVSTGSHAVMIFFDRMLLSVYSSQDLSAVLSAGMLNWTLIALPLGTIGYCVTFVSQYHGAGRDDRARAAVWQALWLSLVCGLVMLAVLPFVPAVFRTVGHPPDVQAREVAYFSMLVFASPLRLLIGPMFCHFSGRGETHVPMIAALVGNGFNVLLSYVLIFGRCGCPEMGLRGAALGTVIASATELVFFLGYIHVVMRTTREWMRCLCLDLELCGRLIRFGFPAGVQQFLDAGAIAVLVAMVGRIGPTEMNATTLAFNINALVFVPLVGLGMATGTLVGHAIGRGRLDLAERSAWLAAKFGLLFMGFFAVACVFIPDLILLPYKWAGTKDLDALREPIKLLLKFCAAFAVFDTLAVIFGSAVRGAGDTRFSLYLIVSVNWTVMALPVYLLDVLGMNTLGRSWIFGTAAIAVMGVAFLARFVQGRWRSMTVMREDETAAGEPA